MKGNYETSGVDSGIELANCEASMNENHHVDSILHWAQLEGLSTGFVTTTRVTHATPAALYSHTSDRRWECEAKMPLDARQKGCKDIGRQLIEDLPGKKFNVIMGGGRQCLESNITGTTNDPIDTWACVSADGRHLIQDWKNSKRTEGLRHVVVQNNQELNNLDVDSVDYVLGKNYFSF